MTRKTKDRILKVTVIIFMVVMVLSLLGSSLISILTLL